MASDAVGLERISRIVGYKITKGNFSNSTPNLPQRIALFAEANEANQSSLDLTPTELTSAQQAGQLYGYGSPIYAAMRILRPINGGGIGGIPVIAYPQAKAGGSTAKVLHVTPTGVATGNGKHTLIISGRENIDGVFYDINVNTGDTTADLTAKIEDAINNVLGAPLIATATDYVTTLTSKWKGLTSDAIVVKVDTNGNDLGITYTITSITSGSGTPSVAAALALFGNDWNTIVINGYGTDTSTMTALEDFNGIPDPSNPTGRFTGIIMKPFIAISGSTAEDPSSITDTRLNNVTIALAPAPLSDGLPIEAAANMALLFGRVAQDNPNLDVAGKAYPDMPTPATIGAMSSYDSRDSIVKKGCSTVDLVTGVYIVQDFVTTYHPVGELPPQFRYPRNLMIDFNIRFGYYLLEQINVVDHSISNDNDIVTAQNTIKPKQWTQILQAFADDLSQRALIVDPVFMQKSITVNVGTSNPDRLESFFRYKRSGFVRIASTTAEAGFNFGTLN